MDTKESIVNAREGGNTYIRLGILEAMAVWREECPDEAVPEQLRDDMASLFGEKAVKTEQELLLSSGALSRLNGGLILSERFYRRSSDMIDETVSSMQLSFGGECVSADEFLQGLGGYLVREAGAIQHIQTCKSRLCLTWNDETYDLRIAFSPVWLPAIADRAAGKKIFVAAICPVAALAWEKTMIGYYEYPSFRDHIACYDPWNFYKINISKGGLFTYFDWHFRDTYKSKFWIPDAFSRALFDMGLMRYNDEK